GGWGSGTVWGGGPGGKRVTAMPSAMVSAVSVMLRRYAPSPITSTSPRDPRRRQRVEAQLRPGEPRPAQVIDHPPAEDREARQPEREERHPHGGRAGRGRHQPPPRAEPVHARARHPVRPTTD